MKAWYHRRMARLFAALYWRFQDWSDDRWWDGSEPRLVEWLTWRLWEGKGYHQDMAAELSPCEYCGGDGLVPYNKVPGVRETCPLCAGRGGVW